MSSLLRSLRKNSTSKAIKSAKDHLRKAIECVMTLRSAFQKIEEGNFKEARHKMNALDDLERQADEIRRSIILEITNSEIEETTKEALAHLVKNIDRIANTANSAGRIFYQIPDEYFTLLFKGDDTCMEMIDKSVQAVKLLDNMVDELLGKGKKIDEINQKIQHVEHDVDVGLSEVYDRFLHMKDPIPPFVAIQVSKGVNYIEAITDSIEDTADYIKVLTIRKD